MKKLVITFVTLFAITSRMYGQAFEPLELAQKIFSKDEMKNIKNYVTGEYTGRPNGQDLQQGSTTKFNLLEQTETKAVVALTILNSSNDGIDIYLYFEKDSIWKMNAFRALAMTGIIKQVKNELEAMTPNQVDEIIAKSQTKKKQKTAIFTSREDYEFQLGNAKLTLNLDENIIQYFLKNKTEFERIKNLALAEIKGNLDEERSIELVENLKEEYRKLFISSISIGGYEFGKCINFQIGGILDNSVGYIYVKDKKDLPEMNSNRVIMVREIGNGWYVYKTT